MNSSGKIITLDFEDMATTKGIEINVNGRNTGIQEIGEVFRDSFNFECFFWKACDIPDFEFPEDYQIQSPPFSFASASWILKIYPYFRMPQSNNPSFDVVLERLHSEIDHHAGKLYLRTNGEIKTDWNTTGFLIDAHHTQGSALTFKLKEEDIPNLRCLHFCIEVKVKLDIRIAAGIKTLRDFKELYFNQEDCDVIIKVKGVEFPAHKNILKAQSPVFASNLRSDMKEKATGIIDIKDCEPSSFSDFLCFLYCGHVENLSAENIFNLFITADKYDVSDLRMECMEFMKCNLSVDIFCDTFVLAIQYSEKKLIEIATAFFKDNLQRITQTAKWQSFLTEYPIESKELLSTPL